MTRHRSPYTHVSRSTIYVYAPRYVFAPYHGCHIFLFPQQQQQSTAANGLFKRGFVIILYYIYIYHDVYMCERVERRCCLSYHRVVVVDVE